MNDERTNLIFDFIVQDTRAHRGNSPSQRMIGQALGIETVSVIAWHVAKLAKQGRIEKDRFGRIMVVDSAWSFQGGR